MKWLKRNSFLTLIFFTTLLSSCSTVKKHVHAVRPEEKVFNLMWTRNYDPIYETGNLPIALQSPYMHEGILYIGNNSGYMTAHEGQNGRSIWTSYEKGQFHGVPVVHKESVIYGTTEGRIFSRHYLTGKLNYEVEVGASIESKGTVYKGRIFFQLRNHAIICLDVETGKILWTYKRSVPYLTTVQRVSTPTIYRNKIYVGFADGNIVSLSVEEGILLWERKLSTGNKFVDVDMTPVFSNNQLFIGSLAGELFVLQPDTGRILRKFDHVVTRSPILVGDSMIFGNSKGEVVALDDQLNETVHMKVSDKGVSSLIFWKNKVIAATLDGRMVVLDPKSLNIEEQFYFGHPSSAVFGDLQVSEGKLAVMSSRNRLYVFK